MSRNDRTVEKRRMMAHQRKEQERKSRMAQLFVFVIAVAAAFVLGVLARSNMDLMAWLGIETEATATQQAAGTAVSSSTYDSFSARLAEVESILNNDSLDSFNLDATTNALMRSLAESTEDPYFRYFDEQRYELYVKENTSKKYSGVGVLFGESDGRAYVAEVFAGSEAESKGVLVGDVVSAVDGDSTSAWTNTEVNSVISSKQGEDVNITWERPGAADKKTFSTTLKCLDYKETNVTYRMKENNVGYVKVSQFTQNAATLVSGALKKLDEKGARSFVLDLRNCPGGFLSQAVDIASLFVKSGNVVQVKTRTGLSERTVSGSTATDAPLVVLVNGRTAAAAEVLAACLSDNSRATLVGTKTMGKGSVQIVQTLSFGGAVRYTAAFYLSPTGHDINSQGVSPDYTVSGDDIQLSYACQTAASLVK
ncbi:MAG: S41 family peptidase [Coriobacteriia bacterium]|nr:S41 family peptidase [Coriobacteriia bacterium]